MKGRPVRGGDLRALLFPFIEIAVASMKGRPVRGGDVIKAIIQTAHKRLDEGPPGQGRRRRGWAGR